MEFIDEQRNEIEVFQECMEDLKRYIILRNEQRAALKKTVASYNSLTSIQPGHKLKQDQKNLKNLTAMIAMDSMHKESKTEPDKKKIRKEIVGLEDDIRRGREIIWKVE